MRNRERLVPLTNELEETPGFPLYTCNWCMNDDPALLKDTKAVVALEHDGSVHRYYGMCGNHAETLDVSPEWKDVGGLH